MPNKDTFTDADLTNMVRGFDAPAKESLLETLREQAREREQKLEKSEDVSSLKSLYRDKEVKRKKDYEDRE